MNNEPLLLFIKGVYTADIDDINEFFIDSDVSHTDDESMYDEIPNKYTGLVTWFKKTNLLCGNCGLSHNNPPVFIPEYFSSCDKNKCVITIYKVLFCSFPCCATYIKYTFKDEVAERCMIGLKYVYKEFTGDDIDYIQLAPIREDIDIFGGSSAKYTVRQFRHYINTLISIDEYII